MTFDCAISSSTADHRSLSVPVRAQAPRCVLLSVALAFVVALAFAPSAYGDYEQVPEQFGVSGEAEQLRESQAIAVNVAGAGGVEAGSIYVVGKNSRVLRFSHGAEGEPPQFQEAWGWGIGKNAGEPLPEYQRCGPAYAAEPRPPATFPECRPPSTTGLGTNGGEQSGNFPELGGVAVDQATGDVYVLNKPSPGYREHHLIEIFSPTGQAIGEGFGDRGRSQPATSAESIAEGPQNLHEQGIAELDGIAVDDSGVVYVLDRDFTERLGTQVSRVMSFEPAQAGNYEHYVYAGQAKDITDPRGNVDPFARIALIGSTDLVTGSGEFVREYSTSGSSEPVCTHHVTGGNLDGMTANAVTGEVFYFLQARHPAVRRLGPCNLATSDFPELEEMAPTPRTEFLRGLAMNPSLHWSAQRPAGVLYGVDSEVHGTVEPRQFGIGDVFAPAQGFPPVVESESVAGTTASSTTLQAQIDPRGQTTEYAFQYLTEAQYQANEPDERQSLTVSATGGLLGLGFQGAHLGGEAIADVTSGSTQATNLKTATATATLSAALGKGNVAGALGKGTVISGLATITGASATSGAFAAGQGISGKGIPSGTTVAKVETEGSLKRLTISVPATESAVDVSLSSGAAKVTGLTTEEGAFKAGQQISGAAIQSGTTVVSATATELTLSKPITAPGTAVSLEAGSTTLTSVVAGIGELEAGRPIQGKGIPLSTKIVEVNGSEVVISQAATKAGTGVAVSDPGPYPLAVGETVEGPGIAPGTKVAAIEAGQLTLSRPAEATQVAVQLRAGIPFDASAGEVQKALEGLGTIGKGNVQVSGGPGDEVGSSPYEVTFSGDLTNRDLPELEADASALTGGPATATVATAHGGGGGFADAPEAPASQATLDSNHIATAPLTGLSPETAYRFRVIAESHCNGPEEAPCEATGPAVAFSTYPIAPTNLPDNRAYELVSPAQKQGGEVFPADAEISSCHECKPPGGGINIGGAVFPRQSSPDGDEVAYEGYPFSPEEGAAVYNSYISRRTTSGWQTTAMSPQRLTETSELSYGESLGEGLITQTVAPQLTGDAPAGYGNLYLQDAGNPAALQPLLTEALFAAHPPHREPLAWNLEYEGHSPDFSAQYFAVNDALTGPGPYAPEPADPGVTGRDLYEWRAGSLSLVNVLPGNAAVASGASLASASPDTHPVSEGGHRVFWEAGGHLYVREDNRTTREIHDPGAFLTASPDGRTILLSDGCIYALEEGRCAVDLTQGHGGFLGVVGQSEDLSRIYFVDEAALAAGAEPGTCRSPNPRTMEEEEKGNVPPGFGCNLYLYEAGVGMQFVATLPKVDGGGTVGRDDWAAEPGQRTAEASPKGRYLAFVSTARLTGFDNIGPCQGFEFQRGPCREVFLYDSTTGRLTCLSCNPAGEAPLGNSTLRVIGNANKSPWLPQPRYLTDQGRLLFDTSERLTPQDTNGRVEDVYEAEPAGVGSCLRPAGCVSLISPGTGSADSNFLAMGGEGEDEGSNVFFTTREELVPNDTDELIDLYDAREGGGFPSETETQRAECQGESCQPVPQAPNDATPASSAFRGAGNVKQAPHRKRRHKKHAGKHHRTKKKHLKKKAEGKGRAAGHHRGSAK